MRERLDQLDDHQRAQLRELKGVEPTSKRPLDHPVRDTDGSQSPPYDLDSDLDNEDDLKDTKSHDEDRELAASDL